MIGPSNKEIPIIFRRMIGVFSFFVLTIGIVSLLGWFLNRLEFASISAGMVPIAPSSAILLILEAAAIYLCSTSGSRRVKSACLIFNFALATLTSIILVESSQAKFSELEHFLFPVSHEPGKLRLGHMSPISAFLFIISSLSFIWTYISTRLGRWAANIAWGLACFVMIVGVVLSLGYLFGMPLFYIGDFIPPAALTSIGFILLGLSLFHFALPSTWLFEKRDESMSQSLYMYLVVYGFVSSLTIIGGYVYYKNYERQFRHEVEKQLRAIAELKKMELMKWRTERLADAEVYFNNRAFTEMAGNCLLQIEAAEECDELRTWLIKETTSHFYDQAFIVDRDLNLRVSTTAESIDSVKTLSPILLETMRSGTLRFEDFYRETDTGVLHLALIIPFMDKDLNPFGAMVFNIHPKEYLYPFINRWPVLSYSGETVLVRREGNEVVFLNDLRFQDDTTLKLRFPLSRIELPAVRAALGEEGIFEGNDYKGEPVVSYLLSIPDSPWAMVTKVSKKEVYEPLRNRLQWISLFISALIVGIGAGFGFVWRRQSLNFYIVRYKAGQAVMQSESRLKRAEKLGLMGHWEFDLTSDSVTLSDEMIRILGLQSHREASIATIKELIHPEDHETYDRFLEEISKNGHATVNYRICPPTGAVKYLTSVGERSDDMHGKMRGMFGAVIDVTDLRLKERELKEKNEDLERFTYTVSHDLKSPLITIKTFAGYISKDIEKGDKETIEKDLSFIAEATGKMSRLLDELLELSRIGRKVDQSVEVTLQEVVNEAVSLVAGRISERKVEIKMTDRKIVLFGDRSRLVELFLNLIDNAVKFMGDQESPLVEIGAKIEQNSPVIFVKDNGKGIDPRHIHKLFGLFEKLEVGTEGSGIGLAIVKRIVEIHGGRIWAESEGLGKGTIFRFTLSKIKLPES